MSPRSALILRRAVIGVLVAFDWLAFFAFKHLRLGFDLYRWQQYGQERTIRLKMIRDAFDLGQVGDRDRVVDLEVLDIHLER